MSNVVLDCPLPRALADFYRDLLGWEYQKGQEIEDVDGDDWLVLTAPAGGPNLAFQRDRTSTATPWPDPARPLLVHLDLDVEDLPAEHRRVTRLGARPLTDAPAPGANQFRVYADPAGHLFCLCQC
jgi:catechol 2,3-dioxygenase-like lactoylglutathione lyase family enzyme